MNRKRRKNSSLVPPPATQLQTAQRTWRLQMGRILGAVAVLQDLGMQLRGRKHEYLEILKDTLLTFNDKEFKAKGGTIHVESHSRFKLKPQSDS